MSRKTTFLTVVLSFLVILACVGAFRVTVLPPVRTVAPMYATAMQKPNRMDYPLGRLLQDFDDDFFFRTTPSSFFPVWKKAASEMTPALSTFKVDVVENDKSYTVKCDMPGMSKEDIKVKHEGDLLMVSAERKDTKEEKDETHHVKEISYGKFYRSFRLPLDTNAEGIEATMSNGVLSVTIPKTEPPVEKEKVVEVKEL